jgi:nicotinamidase-related amidase
MSNSKAATLRSVDLLAHASSRLLIVDVQEKLLPLIDGADRLVARCALLIEGAKILGVPVYGTEQYPRGLGHTTPELASRLPSLSEKIQFSCAEALAWGMAAEQTDDRFQIVVAGIEAHVCILQTVLDLLAGGFQVFVPADAIASRGALDRQIAIDRMAGCGATIVTTESVLFEWCERAGTPEFKQVSALIKQQS